MAAANVTSSTESLRSIVEKHWKVILAVTAVGSVAVGLSLYYSKLSSKKSKRTDDTTDSADSEHVNTKESGTVDVEKYGNFV